MPVETRKRKRSSMDEDGPKQTPDEALKEAEDRGKRARAEAKDKKADASVADLTRLFGHMGGRRKTRKHKKRGGEDHADTIARCREEVKELEEAVDRLRRQRRGGTRNHKISSVSNKMAGGKRSTRKHKKHPRKTRKTRRGGVEQTPEELAVKKLRAELDDLEKNTNATPEQIAKKRTEFIKALDKERFVLRGQRM